MVERQRPTAPETSPLREQGGLTLDHWQYIASLKFNDPKINQYTQAKAAGLIDEEQGPFIGSRHWQSIYYETLKKTDGFERLVGMILRPTNFHLAQEVRKLSEKERRRVITCNDYYSRMGADFDLDDNRKQYGLSLSSRAYWVPEKNTWYLNYSEVGFKHGMPWELEERTSIASSQIILNHWLLTEVELGDPIHTSPNELMRVIREKVPVEELIERIRRKRTDYKLVSGWEKPLPQAV